MTANTDMPSAGPHPNSLARWVVAALIGTMFAMLLAVAGTPSQQDRWLRPIVDGKVRIGEMPVDHKGEGDGALAKATAKAIDEVTKGIEGFAFNKAIAKLYELANAIQKSDASKATQRQAVIVLAQLMSPMTPHLSEDIWQAQGGAGLITQAPWPKADPAMLEDDTVVLPIQINGKRRAEISVPKDMPASEVEKIALADEAVVKFLAGQPVKKLIVVPGRMVNVVI